MIRVMVVDDERRAAGMMKRLLEEIGGVEVCGVYTNPLEALQQLETSKLQPQAVFLDIDMPGMRGIELAQRIQDIDESIHILFVTAYSDYAIEAFELHSLDYVLKPVSKERLEKSVIRLQASLNKSKPAAPRSQMAAALSIQCFGRFLLRYPDGQPLKWRTAKTKELCAFLVHHAGHSVNRDVILDTIWQDVPLEKALANLYTIISYLRKMFAEEGLKMIILKEDTGYKMDLSSIRCDMLEFQQKASSRDWNDLELAVRVYEGRYIQEEYYDWALGKQEELDSQAGTAYNKLIGHFGGTGELAQATAYAEKLLQLTPYSDLACRQLMQLYADAGRRTDALLCYQKYEQAVRLELDVEPDKETFELYAAISGL